MRLRGIVRTAIRRANDRWMVLLERLAERTVARGRIGSRTLAIVVRRGDLEHLRRVVHAASLRGSEKGDPGGGALESQERASGAAVLVPGSPFGGNVPTDVALTRAVISACFATPGASIALESAAANASTRLVKAAIGRLVAHPRTDMAWRLVRMRPDVTIRQTDLRSVISGVEDAAELEQLVAQPELVLPRLSNAQKRAIGALAAIERGQRAMAADDARTAHEWFERSVAYRDSPEARVWLARAAEQEEMFEVAFDHASIALRLNASYRPAMVVLARVDEALGRREAARQRWDGIVNASTVTPGELREAWESLGRIGELSQQLVVAERMLGVTLGRPDARALKAVTLWQLGQRDEAEECVAELRDVFDAPAIRALAFYLGRTGRSSEAYQALAQVSLLVRGPAAVVELVRSLQVHGYQRLANQALSRALGEFPEIGELLPLQAGSCDAVQP